MSYIANFFRFWYDFIVGDDWSVAVGVVIALVITAFLAHQNVTAWWLMPIGDRAGPRYVSVASNPTTLTGTYPRKHRQRWRVIRHRFLCSSVVAPCYRFGQSGAEVSSQLPSGWSS